MPIYEIKNPAPLPGKSQQEPRRTDPVLPTFPVMRIRHLKREWQRRRYEQQTVPEKTGDIASAEEALQQVNRDLQNHRIALHLRLQQTDDGLLLEIYDCTDGHVCGVLHDRIVTLTELPKLINGLIREAGIIIDTQS